ncbi:MAG TPA: histidine phosphatase family protein [Actinomycetales bacterium]|nr:histidine phosphatase family protein [Actinomycetales bacterium]
MAKSLLLMRHSKAASPEGTPDHERPLAGRGARDAPAAGRWIADRGLLPDLVLASDSMRTRQTTELALQAMAAGDAEVRYLPELYSTGVHQLLHLVAETSADVGTLLVVGHEPTMSSTVQVLCGSPVSFPTSAVAVLQVDGWADTAAGTARLDALYTP